MTEDATNPGVTAASPPPVKPPPEAPRKIPFREALALCGLAGRRLLTVHLVLVLLQGGLPLVGLYAMKWLIDAVVDGVNGGRSEAEVWTAVFWATAIAATVAFAGNLVRGVSTVVAEAHGRRLADACSQRLQDHAQGLDLGEFDRSGFHDLLHRAGAEASQRPVRLVQDLAGLGTAFISLLLMSAVLALTALWLPIVVAVAAVPISLAHTRHARQRFAWHQQHVREQREIGYLGGVLTGRATAKDVRMHGAGAWFADRVERLRTGLRTSLHRLAMLRARDELLVYTLASAALFGAYLHLGHLAIVGVLSVGSFVLHAQAVQRAQNSVRDLLGAGAAIGEDRMFLGPLARFLQLGPEVAAGAAKAAPLTAPPAVTGVAITFAYPETTTAALDDAAFVVRSGERCAIVGRNGSGKSTLLKLLCRLYDPDSGAIAIDGTDLRTFAPELWRHDLAVMFQDANGFELSLRDNLTLGRELTDKALWAALEVTGLDDTVRALPAGLATPLSRRLPGGIDWSGGNLRRLALARALAAPSPLLILDEPFAQLDALAVARVEDELERRAGAQTIFIADHHAAVVRGANRVLVLEGGRLVAAGTPAEVATNEHYRALFAGN